LGKTREAQVGKVLLIVLGLVVLVVGGAFAGGVVRVGPGRKCQEFFSEYRRGCIDSLESSACSEVGDAYDELDANVFSTSWREDRCSNAHGTMVLKDGQRFIDQMKALQGK
jgi:hypothetical protein